MEEELKKGFLDIIKTNPKKSIGILIVIVTVILILYIFGQQRLRDDKKITTTPINLEIKSYKKINIKEVYLGLEKCKKEELPNMYSCPNNEYKKASVKIKLNDSTEINESVSLKEKEDPYIVTLNKREIDHIKSKFLTDSLNYKLKLSNFSDLKTNTEYLKINGSDTKVKFENENLSFFINYKESIQSYKPLSEFTFSIGILDNIYISPKVHFFTKDLFSDINENFFKLKQPDKLQIINYDRLRKFENIKLLNSGENNPKEFFIKFDINNLDKDTVLNFYQGKKTIWRFENSKYKIDIRSNKESDKYIENNNEYFMQGSINQNGRVRQKIDTLKVIFERRKINEKYECSIKLQSDSYMPFSENFNCDEVKNKTDFYLNIEKTKVKVKQEIFSISNLKTGERKENYPDF